MFHCENFIKNEILVNKYKCKLLYIKPDNYMNENNHKKLYKKAFLDCGIKFSMNYKKVYRRSKSLDDVIIYFTFRSAFITFGISLFLLIFGRQLNLLIDAKSLPESYFARNITLSINTILRYLFYFGAFTAAINSVGLCFLGFDLLRHPEKESTSVNFNFKNGILIDNKIQTDLDKILSYSDEYSKFMDIRVKSQKVSS